MSYIFLELLLCRYMANDALHYKVIKTDKTEYIISFIFSNFSTCNICICSADLLIKQSSSDMTEMWLLIDLLIFVSVILSLTIRLIGRAIHTHNY